MNDMEMFQLKGKVAVVTGGYGHLGASIVDALYSAGAKVIVLGRSEAKFKTRFSQNNNSIFFKALDVTDSTQINAVFDEIKNDFKQIDILFNNAASSKGRDPEYMTDEEWDTSLDGVLSSVFKCIRRIIPIMKSQGNGKIINISSMYGVVSPDFRLYDEKGFENFRNPPHYGAAKAAIIQLTKYYACYLGGDNIQVNTITPGPFPNTRIQEEHPAFIEKLKERNPLNRIGDPKDLQGVAILLSSKASDFITGQNFIVDGGWTAW